MSSEKVTVEGVRRCSRVDTDILPLSDASCSCVIDFVLVVGEPAASDEYDSTGGRDDVSLMLAISQTVPNSPCPSTAPIVISAPSTTATSSITAADQPVSDASSLSNTNQLSPQQQQDATSSAQSCPSPVALRTTSSRSQRQESPQPPNDPLLLPHHPHDHSMPDAPLPYPSTKKRTKKEQSILDTTQLVLRHLQDDSAFFAQASQLEERRPSPTTTRNIPVFDTNGMSVPDKERLSYIVCVVIGRPKLTMAGYYLPFNQWVLTVLSVSHHI